MKILQLTLGIIWLFAGPALADEIRIVDGDTIEVSGAIYRLHGIDAPEYGQKCSAVDGGTWPCGREATSYLKSLVKGRTVLCDDRGNDDYGRIIGVCYAGSMEINEAMVAAGMAWAFIRYSKDYVQAERLAQVAGLGIWRAPSQTAWDYRSERWKVEEQQSPDGCPIKGNISENGHIYHAPWSPWYSRTKIDLSKGERWFCSEAEAVSAGWRAPIWGG